MLTRRCLVLASCGVLTAWMAESLVAQQASAGPAVQASAEEVVLEFGDQGEAIAHVISVFSETLAQPVDWLPDEVANVAIHVSGTQRVARDRVRDFFDSLLERHGFWSWDDLTGGSPQIIVRKKSSGAKGASSLPFTARVISLGELAAGPVPRTPLYVVTFQLQHLDARNLMTTLSAMLDPSCESLRNVDGSNTLVVKASRDKLLQVRDMLAAADVPPPGSASPASGSVDNRLSAVDQRLASIEQRLVAIEARLAALEPKSEK